MPLSINLVIRSSDFLKGLLLRSEFDSSEINSVDHDHDAIAQLLRISLRASSVESLEKVKFRFVVARPFEDF